MYACQTTFEFKKKEGKENICRNSKTQFRKKTHTFTKRANEMNDSRSFITDQRKQTDILNNKL